MRLLRPFCCGREGEKESFLLESVVLRKVAEESTLCKTWGRGRRWISWQMLLVLIADSLVMLKKKMILCW